MFCDMKQQTQFSSQLEVLDVQHQALREAQQLAEAAEGQLREELEALRTQGDQEDRQRMVSEWGGR